MSITAKLLDIHSNYQLCMDGTNCGKLFELFNEFEDAIVTDFDNIITQWNTEAKYLDKTKPNDIHTILNQLQSREIIMDIKEFRFRGRDIAWPTILLDIYINQLTTDELDIYNPPCYYGNDCYRKNKNHTHRFSHKSNHTNKGGSKKKKKRLNRKSKKTNLKR